MSRTSEDRNLGTPEDYNGFEYAWMFDADPVFNPSAAVMDEKDAGRPLAFNPEDEEETGPKQIGWADQVALSYNAAYMEKSKLIASLRQYAALAKRRVPLKPKIEGGAWPQMLNEAADWLAGGSGKPYWGTFGLGNTKLPFYEWSVVAAGTCPGAGACLNFCYSIKFWFRIDVFRRQLMNTILFRFHPDVVREEFMKLDFEGVKYPFMRLHVHGDFQGTDPDVGVRRNPGDENFKSVDFWMETIAARPEVNVYAYSKSWELLLDYDRRNNGEWPKNFILNLSSGSKYGEDMRQRMSKLSCTRGDFVAIDLSKEEAKLVHEIEVGEIKKSAVLQEFLRMRAEMQAQKREEALAKGKKVGKIKKVGFERSALKPEHMEILGRIRKTALSKALQMKYAGTGKKIPFACPGFCATCIKVPGGFAHACGSENFKVPIAIGIH
jgi:hypothetical protein